MNAETVAAYLQENPQFFEQYAEILSGISIPHPHGGRTISLSERQMISLRDKNRQLERKIADFLSFGEENDALGEKMHRISVMLVGAKNTASLFHLFRLHLRNDFSIPHSALCLWEPSLWELPEGLGGLSEFSSTNRELKSFAQTLEKPYCGSAATTRSLPIWPSEDASRIRSEALAALKNGKDIIGLVALGSEEAERFYPEMGTVYLERLGELLSAAIVRLAQLPS